MIHEDAPDPAAAHARLPLLVAAELQDHLLSATNDLARLQVLLADACTALTKCFHSATEVVRDCGATAPANEGPLGRFGDAVVALQFQDMASQLIRHTHQRLRSCVDRLARETFADDEDGHAEPEQAPLSPNPVTQDEMDAGSVELF